jgi:hypothetical protein
MTEPDKPRVVEAATGRVETGETDVSGPPEAVPEGFPGPRAAHEQARPEVPEGDVGEPGDAGEPADAGPETCRGKAVEDHDTPHTRETPEL